MEVSAKLEQMDPVKAIRVVLSSCDVDGWIVGGTVRDLLLNRNVEDIDVVVTAEAGQVAKHVARQVSGDVFSLSDKFGTWRVIGPGRKWQVDISPVNEGGIEADLGLRDFTVNAIAVRVDGDRTVDPTGGVEDLNRGILRATSEDAYRRDPLRILRLARLSCDFGFEPDSQSLVAAKRYCKHLKDVSGERVFYEFRKLVISDGAISGLSMLDDVGGIEVLLPELSLLKGIGQTPYHHLDAHGHTIEVLRQVMKLEKDMSALGDRSTEVVSRLAEPLADDLSFMQALRFGAIFHDLGKSKTHARRHDGSVTFMGHDREGRVMTADICRRLRTSGKLSIYLQGLTLHHLRLGFLVHEKPLSRKTVYQYIKMCEPVALEVTVLSVADRLATKGMRTKQQAIEDHLELAREMIEKTIEWRDQYPRMPLLTGDELTEALSIEPGPEVGQLMSSLDEAQYVGEIATKEDALKLAKAMHGEKTH